MKMASTGTPIVCGATGWQIRAASPGGHWITLGYTLGDLIIPELLGIDASGQYTKYLNRGDAVSLPNQGHLLDVSTSRSV